MTKLRKIVESVIREIGDERDIKRGIEVYLKKLTERHQLLFDKNYPNLEPPTFEAKFAPKWIKIFYMEGGIGNKAIHCFVDMDGNIYKPATYNSPAKGKRGNIYDANPPLSSRDFYR